jgi:Caspase domain
MGKALIILSAILMLTIKFAFSQAFSGRTNDVFLNYKGPATSTTPITLPEIYWTTPNLEYSNSQSYSIVIEAFVHSDIELKSIKIMISDGSTVRGEKPVEVSQARDYKIKQSIMLQDGQNVIDIIAENSKGGKVSSSRIVLAGKDAMATAVSVDRKDYVLLFATDEYDNWNDLVNPIDDARSLVKILSEKYGFETELVENPNTDDVFNKLRDYAERKFKPQDQLMVFFAGHGYFDDTFGEGFVVAKNSMQNDKAKTSYISHSRLRQIINNIPSEHVLLTMDVCFGGTFDPMIAANRNIESGETDVNEFLVRKLGQKTRKYLTSGGKTYVSDGIPGKHSPFTLKLLQAFSEGGGSDHILTLTEIKSYIEKLKPEPRLGSFGDDKTDSDFVFVLKN